MPSEPCRYQPPQFVSVTVQVFKACQLNPISGKDEPVLEPKVIQCLKGEEAKTRLHFERFASIESQQCTPIEAIAAVPEWWQVRPGANRPQLVILYAELKQDGKLGRSRYALTLPHYCKEQAFRPIFPSYRKGQWEGILTLADNSKLIVNAVSQIEATTVINSLKVFIAPKQLEGSFSKVGERKGQELLRIKVVPVSARFFATGQKDTNPDWVKDLRK